jgi:hypothetical protein
MRSIVIPATVSPKSWEGGPPNVGDISIGRAKGFRGRPQAPTVASRLVLLLQIP